MKNIRRKNIKTYYLQKSQKSSAFHHHQTVKSKTSEMIKIIKTVYVHNSLYFEKEKRQNKRIKSKKRSHENQKSI